MSVLSIGSKSFVIFAETPEVIILHVSKKAKANIMLKIIRNRNLAKLRKIWWIYAWGKNSYFNVSRNSLFYKHLNYRKWAYWHNNDDNRSIDTLGHETSPGSCFDPVHVYKNSPKGTRRLIWYTCHVLSSFDTSMTLKSKHLQVNTK